MNRYLAQFALLTVALIWGWTFVLVKEGASEIGPLTFLAWRFALAFLVLILLFWRRLRRFNWALVRRGLGIGLALFAGYLFQTWGLLYTGASKSGFITGLSVVLVPLFGALFFKERISLGGWLGVGLAAAGLGLVLLGHGGLALGTEMALNVGDLLTLLCAVSFAMHIVLIGRFVDLENYPPLLVVQIGLVFVLSLLGAFVLERPTLQVSAQTWEAIVITGLLATALAFFLQNRFQPLAGATQTAIIFSAEPVFAGLFGYLLLGERFSPLQFLGAIAIFGGILTAQLGDRRIEQERSF